MSRKILAPSILSCDFTKIKEQILEVVNSGADWIHIDVMDGHFVPNLTFGIPVIKSLRKLTDKPFDVHLMITNPEQFIEKYVEAGADYLTVHYEVCYHLDRILNRIKSIGAKAGVVINPATSVDFLLPILHLVDLVLIMTVNPGFGGQKFIPYAAKKIEFLSKFKEKEGLNYLIEVDGGINLNTIKIVLDYGVDVVVAGSSIFKNKQYSISEVTKRMKEIMSRY